MPPGHEQRHHHRGQERGGDDDGELAGDPTAARNALGPGEAGGPVLQLEDERRREEHTNHAGYEGEPGEEVLEPVEARGESVYRLVACIRRVLAEARR